MSAPSQPATVDLAAESGESTAPPRGRGRAVRVFALLAVALGAAGLAVALADPFGGGGSKTGVSDNGATTSLAKVRRGSLVSQKQVSGTLGYAGGYSVVNSGSGTATWLPGSGRVIGRGQVLFRASGRPVILLYGSVPAYRVLQEGMSGPDVQQLNANLVALGYATSSELDPSSDYFGSQTKYALELLQDGLGVRATGRLGLGQAVFLPGAVRLTRVMATLGTMLAPGAVVAQASSTARQVHVDLDAAQQTSVKVGDRVTITLPDNSTTPGVVTGVGKVASSGGSGSTTVPVYIALKHPEVAGRLDQAPVQVAITTARVHDALIVPVSALLALAGGGYAVETVDARGVHHLVPVTTGLFDDADGLVQVSGSLVAGARVVVPAT